MTLVWSEEAKLETWLTVELAVCEWLRIPHREFFTWTEAQREAAIQQWIRDATRG